MKLIDRMRIAISNDAGPALRTAREAAGYSIRQLSDEVGVCYSTVVYIENGMTKPSPEFLAAAAHALDTTIDALIPISLDVAADHD